MRSEVTLRTVTARRRLQGVCTATHQRVFLCVGVVLADFDRHFMGATYQSERDANISMEVLTSAALVAARALHEIASGGKGAPQLKVCCRGIGH